MPDELSDERAKFEKWGRHKNLTRDPDSESGAYYCDVTQAAWATWQHFATELRRNELDYLRIVDLADQRAVQVAGLSDDLQRARAKAEENQAAVEGCLAAERTIAKLRRVVEAVCDEYGDKGWAKTEMVRRLRAALRGK